MTSRVIPTPTRRDRNTQQAPRTIDEFYDEAYKDSPKSCQFPYWTIFLTLGLANASDSIEINATMYLLGNDGFKDEILGGDLKVRGAFLAGSVFAGMLVGGIFTGASGDYIGRRRTLLAGLCSNTIAGICSILSTNVYMYSICEFFSGLGIGALMSSLLTLATESAPLSHRGFFVSFVASFWTVGSIFMAVSALVLFGIHDLSWRWFVAAAVAPVAVSTVAVYFLVPESARYLALVHSHEEAAKTANRVADLMASRCAKLEEEEVRHHYPNVTHVAASSTEYKCKHIVVEVWNNLRYLYSRSLFQRTLALQFTWFCVACGHGLITWINSLFVEIHLDDIYMHCLYFALANIPGNVIASVLMDRMNHKVILSSCMLLTSLSLVYFAWACSSIDLDNIHITISTCAFHAFLVAALCAQSVLTGEIFPTTIRNTGYGVCVATGRIGAMAVQFISGALVDRPATLLLIIACVFVLGSMGPWIINREDASMVGLSDDATVWAPEPEQREEIEFHLTKKGFSA